MVYILARYSVLRLAQHEIAVQFSSQSIGYKFVMSLNVFQRNWFKMNVFRRNWFKIQCRGIDTFKIAVLFHYDYHNDTVKLADCSEF